MNVLKNLYTLFIILLAFPSMTLHGQNKASVSINARAIVVDRSGIELVTVKNMEIDMAMAQDGKIYVSALHDTRAAVLMVQGRADAKFRIKYSPVVEITNRAGNGTLLLQYEMHGFPSDNQGASEPIDAAERTLQISSESKYYLWVGGRIDISNARPGNYDGEFTIEIEYL